MKYLCFYKKQPTYNPQMRQGLLIKYSVVLIY